MGVARLYHHLAPKNEVGIIAKPLIRLLKSHRWGRDRDGIRWGKRGREGRGEGGGRREEGGGSREEGGRGKGGDREWERRHILTCTYTNKPNTRVHVHVWQFVFWSWTWYTGIRGRGNSYSCSLPYIYIYMYMYLYLYTFVFFSVKFRWLCLPTLPLCRRRDLWVEFNTPLSYPANKIIVICVWRYFITICYTCSYSHYVELIIRFRHTYDYTVALKLSLCPLSSMYHVENQCLLVIIYTWTWSDMHFSACIVHVWCGTLS